MSRHHSTSQYTPSGVADPPTQEAGKADLARHDRDGSPSDSESSTTFNNYVESADNEGCSPGECVALRAFAVTDGRNLNDRGPISCAHVADVECGRDAKTSHERLHDFCSEAQATNICCKPDDADRGREQNLE